jgi:hypothetical protein
MPKARPEDLEEPVNRKDAHRFIEANETYFCGYCHQVIEPEHQEEMPCHLCGEFRYLYYVRNGKKYAWSP